ncbi:sensor histidine kinase [Streptomyces flaveus]|uniref:histidine kinase n=1 Tax=Streptomyces flaveus TaxID=66370 RepID=A0A917QWL8_9ACTN|nr:ATP-binding protein [Streptomyces flaveus]GGK72922.1 histidine kinase [Streptomyces flaveus]
MTAPITPARPSTDRPSLAHPRGERPRLRAVALAPLITAVPAALAVVGAVVAAPDSFRVPLACGAGAAALLLCAVVAFASHATQRARLLRRRLEAVTHDAGRLLQERARIAEEASREHNRLAEEFERELMRRAEQFTQEKARLSAELARERTRLGAENDRLAEQLRQARTEGAAAVSTAANAAGRMQALATSMLADLRAMEEKHSDEEVLADLLHLDHRTAQAGRLADSVAVLAGARSGRRWARPIVMESILRGAMGRIGGYQRVRLHSSSEAAVAGHAAEGVMHALAELLDNAANFSPPTAEVHVYVEEVPAGVIVSVEDAGLVMGDVQLRRAERAVSGENSGLGGLTGTRLGLAVVGRLARKYGLKISFRPSARGGTGVLVLIPQDILAGPTAPEPAPALPRTKPGGQVQSQARTPGAYGLTGPAAPESAPASPRTTPGLPVPIPAHTPESYATARALPDLDPEPVPTHESPDRTGENGTGNGSNSERDTAGGLPKRRRGRTLAEAEAKAEAQAQAQAERTRPAAATPQPRPTPAEDAKIRAARFSSFRQAVRSTARSEPPPADEPVRADAADHLVRDTTPAPEPTTPQPPAHATPHPEGDPTP